MKSNKTCQMKCIRVLFCFLDIMSLLEAFSSLCYLFRRRSKRNVLIYASCRVRMMTMAIVVGDGCCGLDSVFLQRWGRGCTCCYSRGDLLVARNSINFSTQRLDRTSLRAHYELEETRRSSIVILSW